MVSNFLKLYQGDTLLGEAPYDHLLVTGLRPERLPYRVVSVNSRSTWANPYSTSTRTEWVRLSIITSTQVMTLPRLRVAYASSGRPGGGTAYGRMIRCVPSPGLPDRHERVRRAAVAAHE
ncbi:hypothetical protein AB0M50_00080 [Nonomuraea fuscirosea]|uniref:hypothetical protein n=1 Tax=Nonomuraea fuscirosea TaxID=1291556 RepID=UPI002DDAA37D|nr:hypothetical protein [Nonomuraea fuscirosea]WSA58629.1 hypothetical protein OIE67_51020 [Nonomuraea fuscirosea]